jgi:hypothetical protein
MGAALRAQARAPRVLDHPYPPPPTEPTPTTASASSAPPSPVESPPSQDEDPEETPADAEPSSRPEARLPFIRWTAGVGARARLVEISFSDGSIWRYESGVFIDVPARLELHPLASHGSNEAGFAVRVDFAMAARFIDQGEWGNLIEEPTTAYRVGAYLGYDRVGRRGSVAGHAGFAYEAFLLDDHPQIPSTRIPIVRVAIGGRIHLAGPAFGLDLGAGYGYLVRLGGLATAFGNDSDGSRFDVSAGFGGHVGRFVYSLGAAFELSYLTFSGTALVRSASSGTERGASASAQVGFQL